MTPEEFNAGCMQFVDKYRQRTSAVKPKQYRIPPEIVELLDIVGLKIIKSFAYSLNISLYKTLVHDGYKFPIPGLPLLNGLDWVWFMSGGESFTADFYLNCNPDSPQYGIIILTQTPNIYFNIHEFIIDVRLWMQEHD